jgi:hypothetical protein
LEKVLSGRVHLGAFLIVVLASCGPAVPATLQPIPGDTRAAIDAADLSIRVGVLAHDSMRGRETGTPGAQAAARYLAAEMSRLGLTPAGDAGTYLQAVPLQRQLTSASVSITTPGGVVTLTAEDILPVSGIGGLPRASRTTASAPLHFAGYLVDPAVPGGGVTGDQMRDAVLVLRLGAPDGTLPGTGPSPVMATLFSPASPAAAVFLVAEEGEADFWSYAAEITLKGSVSLAAGEPTGPAAPPFFLISSSAAEQLLGSPLATAREPRLNLGTVSYAIQDRTQRFTGANVAAIFPGRDPARAAEYVGLGAHYDHVGVGVPVDGDSIYNGADDNASGTSSLLEVAEALAHLPPDARPARPVLFVWKDAEESGLLGSEYFTDNPTVPRQSIIAHLNMDMVGRNHPDSIFVVGSRRISTELGEIVEAVNMRLPQPFIFDYSYDAPNHPEMVYCRSDHYNYARYGIPITFLTTGLHEDYHLPSDTPERIDHEKLARVSDFVYELTMELANRPTRPRVDQPVPPLGTPCT